MSKTAKLVYGAIKLHCYVYSVLHIYSKLSIVYYKYEVHY